MRIGAGLLAASLALCAAGDARAQADPAKQGELVFHIGGCTHCHTAKDGQPLAGGDPLVTPFGTFHPPNITPDPKHGIGGWTEAQFIRAMREGRSPSGAPYYPAFPYTSYTRMTDEDLLALKAYLDTVPAVPQASRGHELAFPFNQRWGIRLGSGRSSRPSASCRSRTRARRGTAAPSVARPGPLPPNATRRAT